MTFQGGTLAALAMAHRFSWDKIMEDEFSWRDLFEAIFNIKVYRFHFHDQARFDEARTWCRENAVKCRIASSAIIIRSKKQASIFKLFWSDHSVSL